MKHISLKRIAISAGAAILLAGGGVIPTFASGDAGVTITGGSLTGGGITFGDFSGITLNGAQKTATATWSVADVVDATGSGDGWHLNLTLTQLKQWDSTLNDGAGGYVEGGKTLSNSSVAVSTAPTVSTVDPTSSDPTAITSVASDTALDTGSPVSLLSAPVNGGMGSYAVTSLGVTLTVPASVYAKTYKTDATVSLVAAP